MLQAKTTQVCSDKRTDMEGGGWNRGTGRQGVLWSRGEEHRERWEGMSDSGRFHHRQYCPINTVICKQLVDPGFVLPHILTWRGWGTEGQGRGKGYHTLAVSIL